MAYTPAKNKRFLDDVKKVFAGGTGNSKETAKSRKKEILWHLLTGF